MWLQNSFIRNIDAGDLLEDFLIASVSSVLFIRFYLFLAHYPQLGGRSFHIAHLLFGGFFMLFAIILLLAYLNRPILQVAAVLGGIGFGTFIDELGKFITQDNNYFYQPTPALIYIIFILLFLIFRMFEHNEKLTKKEYLINALERMEDVVLQDLDTEEKRKTLRILSKCDPKDPIVITLKSFLKNSHVSHSKEGIIQKIHDFLAQAYGIVTQNKYFTSGVIIFFIGKSIFAFLNLFLFIFGLAEHPTRLYMIPRFDFVDWGLFISQTLASIFVVLGVLVIYKSRIMAYEMFRRSLLIAIFFTQFFLFYKEQFSAVIGLIINIIVFVTIQFMIGQEMKKDRKDN